MGEKRVLTADDLGRVDDLEVVEVEVAEWGGSVYLRSLPADESISLGEKMAALPKDKQAEGIFLLLAACLSDESGKGLFENVEDARRVLGKRRPDPLVRLQTHAIDLLGWKQDETVKNASGGAALAASPIV